MTAQFNPQWPWSAIKIIFFPAPFTMCAINLTHPALWFSPELCCMKDGGHHFYKDWPDSAGTFAYKEHYKEALKELITDYEITAVRSGQGNRSFHLQ